MSNIHHTPRVFIIILQYNNAVRTLACLESVEQLTYKNRSVIVVDNNSHGNEYERIYDTLQGRPGYHIIRNADNNGYAAGNNVGIRYALSRDADYVLVVNNDVLLPSDCLEPMVAMAESEHAIGMVAPAIQEANAINYGGRVSWLHSTLQQNYTKPHSKIAEPDFLIGACLLMKKALIEHVGMLDERYFLYFEDAEYSLRTRKHGWRIIVMPEVVITHAVSASTRTLGAARLLRLHYRNSLLFNSTHAPLRFRILLPLWSLYCIVKQLVKYIVQPAQRDTALSIVAGIRDFYVGRFGKIS